MITINNLPEATLRALETSAIRNGRSVEAEIHHIIESAVRSSDRIRLGCELTAISREFGGVDLDIERDKTPAGTVDFQ